MAELKSIPFGRILKWLKKSVVKKITMLGGNSYFYIKYENDASIMIIGKEGEHHYIDQLFWNLVCARMTHCLWRKGENLKNIQIRKTGKIPLAYMPRMYRQYVKHI